MREYDDDDADDSIRLYLPVLQRVIILAAVVIAGPIVMWTITTFVRSYVARLIRPRRPGRSMDRPRPLGSGKGCPTWPRCQM